MIVRRGLAFIIDSFLVLLLFGFLRLSDLGGVAATAVLYHATFRLRTPGRWIARVAVVRTDGSSPGTLRAACRTLAYLLSGLPLGLGFVWALGKERRTWHDRLTDTMVARLPAGTPLRRLRAAGAALGLVALAVTAGAAPGDDAVAVPFDSLPLAEIRPVPLPDGRLAISAHMLAGNDLSDETWRETLRRAKALGVEAVQVGQIAWHKIEVEPGRYEWGYADRVLRINEEEGLGLSFVADFMFVNPGLDGVPRLPAHLEGRAFDDTEVIESLSRMYEAFLALPGAGSVRWLFQHFENAVSVVSERPEEIPRLQRLLRESFARAKRARPGLRTGVCVQRHEKPHWPASEIERWNLAIGTDVVPVISFGPTNFEPEGAVAPTFAEFDAIASAAAGRPIALHECGHNSGEVSGSSHDTQVAFVRETFRLLRERNDRIEFMTWAEYSDLDPLFATAIGWHLAITFGMPTPRAAAYFADNMGTCGLLTDDGRAKPAARAWVEEAARYYRERAAPAAPAGAAPVESARPVARPDAPVPNAAAIRIDVGPEEVLLGPDDPRFGLLETLDMHVPVLRRDDAHHLWLSGWFADAASRGRGEKVAAAVRLSSPDLEASGAAVRASLRPDPAAAGTDEPYAVPVIRSRRAVPIDGEPGPAYLSEEIWVAGVRSLGDGRLLGLFHMEEYYAPGLFHPWYGSVGVAVSADGGRTFPRPRKILTSPHPLDEARRLRGGDDGYRYIGHVHPTMVEVEADGRRWIYVYSGYDGLGVVAARAPVEAAADPSSWRKWNGRDWDEPGLGGRPVRLLGEETGGASMSASWNGDLGAFVLVFVLDTVEEDRQGIYLTLSPDGVRWSAPRPVLLAPAAEVNFPSMIGLGKGSTTETGRENLLLYARIDAAGERLLVRRRVRIIQ